MTTRSTCVPQLDNAGWRDALSSYGNGYLAHADRAGGAAAHPRGDLGAVAVPQERTGLRPDRQARPVPTLRCRGMGGRTGRRARSRHHLRPTVTDTGHVPAGPVGPANGSTIGSSADFHDRSDRRRQGHEPPVPYDEKVEELVLGRLL